MITESSFTYEDQTNLSEAQLTKEMEEALLKGLVEERNRVAREVEGLRTLAEDNARRVKELPDLTRRLGEIDIELERVGGDRQPRNKVRR